MSNKEKTLKPVVKGGKKTASGSVTDAKKKAKKSLNTSNDVSFLQEKPRDTNRGRDIAIKLFKTAKQKNKKFDFEKFKKKELSGLGDKELKKLKTVVKTSTEVDDATKALVAELGKTKKKKKGPMVAQKEQGGNESQKQKARRKVGNTATKAKRAKVGAIKVVLPSVIKKNLDDDEKARKKETETIGGLQVSKLEDRQKVRDIIKQVQRRRLALNVLVEKELADLSSSQKKDSKKSKKVTTSDKHIAVQQSIKQITLLQMTIISRAAKMEAHIPEEFKAVGVVEKVIEDKRAAQAKLEYKKLSKKESLSPTAKKRLKKLKPSIKAKAFNALTKHPSVSDERRVFQRLLPPECKTAEYDMMDPFTLANRGDVNTNNAQDQVNALNALRNVVARCDEIAELGGGFSEQEDALAHIPKAFWPNRFVKELVAYRAVEKQFAQEQEIITKYKGDKATKLKKEIKEALKKGEDIASVISSILGVAGDSCEALTLKKVKVLKQIARKLGELQKVAGPVVDKMKEQGESASFDDAIASALAAITQDELNDLLGFLESFASIVQQIGGGALPEHFFDFIPVLGAVSATIETGVLARKTYEAANKKGLSRQEYSDAKVQIFEAEITKSALMYSLMNEDEQRGFTLAKHSIDLAGQSVVTVGAYTELGTAGAGTVIKVFGKVIRLGNMVAFKGIDFALEKKAAATLEAAKNGDRTAMMKVFKDNPKYAKAYLVDLAKKELNPKNKIKSRTATNFLKNRGVTDKDIASDNPLTKLLVREQLLTDAGQNGATLTKLARKILDDKDNNPLLAGVMLDCLADTGLTPEESAFVDEMLRTIDPGVDGEDNGIDEYNSDEEDNDIGELCNMTLTDDVVAILDQNQEISKKKPKKK